MGFLPQSHGKTTFVLDQVGLGAVMVAHTGNNLVANPHAYGISVTVIAHDVD